jgi:hypothetical protein
LNAPNELASQAPQQLAVPQLIGSTPTIAGVVSMGIQTNKAPSIAVLAAEKQGKSSLGVTLFGWPTASKQPLFIAWDRTGPAACVNLGYSPHALTIPDLAGDRHWDKAKSALKILEDNVHAIREQYGALIIDCASTMTDRLHEDARRFSKNSNPRSHFGDCLMQSKEFYNRLGDIGLPMVWLSWLKEAEIEEITTTSGQKKTRVIPGGPHIIGGFRQLLAGKAHHIFVLEKQRVGTGQPGADNEGYRRVLHSTPWANIACGGRYTNLMPPECPANLGMIMQAITTGRYLGT